jgi:hypothetical protein
MLFCFGVDLLGNISQGSFRLSFISFGNCSLTPYLVLFNSRAAFLATSLSLKFLNLQTIGLVSYTVPSRVAILDFEPKQWARWNSMAGFIFIFSVMKVFKYFFGVFVVLCRQWNPGENKILSHISRLKINMSFIKVVEIFLELKHILSCTWSFWDFICL